MFSLLSLCRQFSAFSEKRSQSRPNNLDKCRRNFIKKNLVSLFSCPSFNHHHLPACFSLPDWMSYFVQILLARQAVRARRRITRRTAKQRLMESKRFLKKLRLLAVEVRVQRVWLIVTKKMLENRFMYNMLQVWHLLPTLCSLQPQSTIPDAFIWLLSGNKRLAYVRIPAYSILFSLVEEQRGRDCGKVSTLYMKVTIPSLVISETHDNLL